MLDKARPSLAGFFEGTNPAPPVHLGTRYDTPGNSCSSLATPLSPIS
ncbi:hypothetical protein [Mesorhizobium sp. M8A.F.Ca.ET.208.01.1.1]|nr:hypothetical protein [Mesorhizobium sp. M8A.F.Ca.ET.208.01.1.1]